MADAIEVGAVVRLKSGGPLMTVEEIEERSKGRAAVCSWFVNDKRERSTFLVSTLEVVDMTPRVR
jgi:uncharacterized protein YodC (DUF2158 family)